jgi:hypothetical protein
VAMPVTRWSAVSRVILSSARASGGRLTLAMAKILCIQDIPPAIAQYDRREASFWQTGKLIRESLDSFLLRCLLWKSLWSLHPQRGNFNWFLSVQTAAIRRRQLPSGSVQAAVKLMANNAVPTPNPSLFGLLCQEIIEEFETGSMPVTIRWSRALVHAR